MGLSRSVTVLGGDGFIGTHLVRRLRDDGHDVRSVDLRGSGHDLRDPHQTVDAVTGAEWVFHLAADMGGVGYFHGPNDYAASTDNARISLNVLDACQRCRVDRLFFASSACAYPIETQQDVRRPPALAEYMLGQGTPDQLYGAEKLWTLRACETSPVDTRVGVLHTVYGPGQESTGPRAKFPPSVAYKALQARQTGKLTLWGDGSQHRSYLYVDDAVDRIVFLMESDRYEGPVNVGYEGSVSCLDAAFYALMAAGCPDAEIVCDPTAGPSGVKARDCSNAKWRRLYGPVDDLPPADGFSNLVHWLDRQEVTV